MIRCLAILLAPGGKLHVTYNIVCRFAGYGEKAGANSDEFAARIEQHIKGM